MNRLIDPSAHCADSTALHAIFYWGGGHLNFLIYPRCHRHCHQLTRTTRLFEIYEPFSE